MTRRANKSMLVAGVPLNRGAPLHYEHDDDTAFTDFNRQGKVVSIHTPLSPLVRVHELMHARHTEQRRYQRAYKGINSTVSNFTEDVRLHATFWPWRYGRTPASIAAAVESFVGNEQKELAQCLEAGKYKPGEWPDFALRMRQVAVKGAIKGDYATELSRTGFATTMQGELTHTVIALCQRGKEGKAARLLQSAFFPPQASEESEGGERTGKKTGRATDGDGSPKMEIIELNHTEHIAEASVGSRLATSGSRLYRPALRRPVLPQRMFVRRAAIEAGGTILIDASGSMGSWDNVKQWCEKAPFGTIAYYAGGSYSGWLYVYARNGKRAAEIVPPRSGGNTVDGPALDWLMQQPGPRTMVTDREFCGAWDSTAQVVRLECLEAAGEVTVVDYSKRDD
jgi:hypothetical protein